MPPLYATRDSQGRVVLSERSFRRLCGNYARRGLLTEQLSALTIREILLSLNEDQRCIILADELAMARDDPARLDPIWRDPMWSDGMYLFRQVCRDLALELWPHPDYNPAAETDEETEPEVEDQEDSDEEENWAATRPVPDHPRPTLSGNPDEGAGPSHP